jgi:hypothetical protein
MKNMKKIVALSVALAFAFSAVQTNAWWERPVDVEVNNFNSAVVSNVVTTVADTGNNTAEGGTATSESDTGLVYGTDNNVGTGENYVRGGDAGIQSGNAYAVTLVTNEVNTSHTAVSASHKGETEVNNLNMALVVNDLATAAYTGGNTVFGGEADNDSDTGWLIGHHNNLGTGGNTLHGGGAGVHSGDAESATSIVNIINRTMVRIMR